MEVFEVPGAWVSTLTAYRVMSRDERQAALDTSISHLSHGPCLARPGPHAHVPHRRLRVALAHIRYSSSCQGECEQMT